MPQAWSRKDERQYEKIKQSSQDRGIPAERAEEVAGRTVSKTRRESGRTPNESTEGTGNPNRRLDDRSVQELRNRARELAIEGRSEMNKSDLVRAIRGKQ